MTTKNLKRSAWATSMVAVAALTTVFAFTMKSKSGAGTNPVRTLEAIRGEEVASITSAPSVPAPITRNYATKVIVNLDVIEKKMQLADGVEYNYWTFGGTVPGKFIRVREGDLVELHLKNESSSMMPHNIDLHAVTGPGGGAKVTLTMPGKETVFTFRALNPGLFIYHCATAPVPVHMSNGMYGMILVQPKEGLPPVDHEYYVMQSEFYTTGAHGEKGLQQFDMEKGIEEKPEYVVFNGAEGSLTGDHALQAKQGETVRLFVGDAGPNLTSSFHIIGEVFDNVYQEGGTTASQHNVQTTLIPSGGAAIVDFRTEMPGDYILVDHSIFRAFTKGALGMLHVTGNPDVAVYNQVSKALGGD